MNRLRRIIAASIVGAALLVHSSFASAACTSPAGAAGSLNWNTATTQFQYCDGTTWQNFGGGGSTFAAGTVGAPGWAVTGDTDTGLWAPAANTLSTSAGGVEVLRLNTVASGVNYLSMTPGAAGSGVTVAAAGTDTNIDIALTPKGTGGVSIIGTSSLQLYSRTNATNGYAVSGEVGTGTGGRAIYGLANTGTGSSVAVMGSNSSTTGTAIYGGANASTGANYGGYFTSNSSAGISLFSIAANAATRGLVVKGAASQIGDLAQFQDSTGAVMTVINAAGNVGIGTAPTTGILHVYSTASTVTGYFRNLAAGGYAISGYSSGTNSVGLSGTSDAASGRGVIGQASSGTGANYGGYFSSISSGGTGVYGIGSAGTGANFGGYFTSSSSGGTALYALAGDAATKGLVVRGAGSQTGDLAQFQNSSGTTLTVVNSSGNVGIGTTAPVANLAGSTALLDLATSGTARLSLHNTATTQEGGLVSTGTALKLQVGGAAAGTDNIITFQTASANSNYSSAERMRIDSNGNVGIGTTGPTARLDIVTGGGGHLYVSDYGCGGWGGIGGSSALTGCTNYALLTLGSDTYINRPSGYNIQFREGNGNQVTFLTGGNVGIGTVTPSYKLDVNGTLHVTGAVTFDSTVWWGGSYARTETKDDAGAMGTQSGFFQTSSPTNYPSGATTWWHLLDVRHNNGANNYAMQIAGSFFDQDLYFRKTNNSASTAWNRFIYANSSGNVGIGTATPAANGLTINHGSTPTLTFQVNGARAGYLYDNGSSFYVLADAGMGTKLNHGDTIWTSSSDRRLKNDIKPLPASYGLSAIDELTPVTFHWRNPDASKKLQLGLVAQDVQKVIPEIVSRGAPTDSAPDGELGIQYPALVVPLIKAVQELKADNDNLRHEVEELRRKIQHAR